MTDLEAIRAGLLNARTPEQAADTVISGLSQQDLAAVLGLYQAGDSLLIQAEDADPEVVAWASQALREPIDSRSLPPPGVTVFSLTASGTEWGLLAVQLPPGVDYTTFGLLMDLLSVRLDQLNRALSAAAASLAPGVSELRTFAHLLATAYQDSGFWSEVAAHLPLLVDMTGAYVGLVESGGRELLLPLVVDGGPFPEREPIPLVGLARAVVERQSELHIDELASEADLLAQAGIVLDRREPGHGTWQSWAGVPLRGHNGQILGLVCVQHAHPGAYDEAARFRLLALADLLALALQLQDRERALAERTALLDVLSAAAKSLGRARSADEALEEVSGWLQQLVGYDRLTVIRADGPALRVLSGLGRPAIGPGPLELPADHFLRRTLTAGAPVHLPHPDKADTLDAVASDWLGLPVVAGGQPIALLALSSTAAGYFSGTDLAVSAILVRLAGAASRAQPPAGRTTERRSLAAIRQASALLTGPAEQSVMLNGIAQLLCDHFDAARCLVLLLEPSSDQAAIAAEYPPGANSGTTFALESDPLLADSDRLDHVRHLDAATDGWSQSKLVLPFDRAALLVPMRASGATSGVIVLNNAQDGKPPSEADETALLAIAGQLAMALRDSERLQEEIRVRLGKSELLSSVGHELRTPLNTIVGYSEMLLDSIYGALPEAQRARIERINAAGRDLHHLIDDVLHLSYLETGRARLEPRPCRLSDLVRDALQSARGAAEPNAITIAFETVPGEALVNADAPALFRVIGSLIQSAIHGMESGELTVRVSPAAVRRGHRGTLAMPPHLHIPPGDYLALTVEDQRAGTGAPAPVLPTERADTGSDHDAGLGLALARELISQQGGFLWVDHLPDAGSRSTLVLPLLQVRTPFQFEGDGAARVLVWDPDPESLRLVCEILSSARHGVIGVQDTDQVIPAIFRFQPAMLAVSAPDEQQAETVLLAVKSDPQTRHIPVILLIGQTTPPEPDLPAFLDQPSGQAALLEQVALLLPR